VKVSGNGLQKWDGGKEVLLEVLNVLSRLISKRLIEDRLHFHWCVCLMHPRQSLIFFYSIPRNAASFP